MKYIVASPEKVRLLHFGGGFRLVRDVAKEADARAAINFGFFSMSKNHPKDSYPVGQVMVDGKNLVLSPAGIEHFHSVYKKDGKISFWQWLPAGCEWGIRTGPRLVESGQICERSISDPKWVTGGVGPTASRSRVAIGIRADSRVVLVYWDAATIRQAAQDMLNLGCVEAVAGDGGGSASWYDSENLQHTVSQRLVPNCFIVEGDSSEQPQPEPKPSPGGEKNMIVCIDPGHGGSDPGAVSKDGILEKHVNFCVAKRVAEYLKRAGAKVLMARTDDSDVGLAARAAKANQAKCDYFVSIHANAADAESANGYEVFHYPGSSGGVSLANKVSGAYKVASGMPLRRVTSANFQVLRDTAMPAILIELGFLTSPLDLALLKEPAFLDKIALGIAFGILEMRA